MKQFCLSFLGLLFGAFAIRDIPRQIGQTGYDLNISLGVVLWFVPHTKNRNDPVAAKHGHNQFADNCGMAWWHPLSMRKGSIVVVNDRPAFPDAVYPDARFRHAVMAVSFRRT